MRTAVDADVDNRFWSKVDAWGPFACWTWTRARDRNGYGKFWLNGTMHLAHRVSWQTLVGPVPEGMSLDHLCRNPACVNPDHLEPVTHAENVRRGAGGAHTRQKTHCPQGHPYDGDNLRIGRTRGERYCRECQRQKDRLERQMHPDRVRARHERYLARKNSRHNTVIGSTARQGISTQMEKTS